MDRSTCLKNNSSVASDGPIVMGDAICCDNEQVQNRPVTGHMFCMHIVVYSAALWSTNLGSAMICGNEMMDVSMVVYVPFLSMLSIPTLHY